MEGIDPGYITGFPKYVNTPIGDTCENKKGGVSPTFSNTKNNSLLTISAVSSSGFEPLSQPLIGPYRHQMRQHCHCYQNHSIQSYELQSRGGLNSGFEPERP